MSSKTVDTIQGVLNQHPEVESAILFGSRAKGNYRTGSDIDLALLGAVLNRKILHQIEHALDESSIPHRFSLLILTPRVDPDVLAHIERVGVNFYERQTGAIKTGA